MELERMDEEAQITSPPASVKLEKLMVEMSQLIVLMKAVHNNLTTPGNNNLNNNNNNNY
jgi:hypothetical protein